MCRTLKKQLSVFSLFNIQCIIRISWKDVAGQSILRYSKMSSSANTSRRRGILTLLLHISKMIWHEHINKSMSFHMQIRFLNSRLPF